METGIGHISAVGIGSGTPQLITEQATAAINAADVIVGYKPYCEAISDMLSGQKVLSSGMRSEVDRCNSAIEEALKGKAVAVISSGDAGIYGMAGLLLELIDQRSEAHDVEVQVVPGVTAANIAAAALGAPLMNDFVMISLSDLLTPRDVIMNRIKAISATDLVCTLYNPRSMKRRELFDWAMARFREARGAEQPCGLVRHAGRDKQEIWRGELQEFPTGKVDMSTIVIIGGPQTEILSTGHLVTKRGYSVASDS